MKILLALIALTTLTFASYEQCKLHVDKMTKYYVENKEEIEQGHRIGKFKFLEKMAKYKCKDVTAQDKACYFYNKTYRELGTSIQTKRKHGISADNEINLMRSINLIRIDKGCVCKPERRSN